MQRDDPANFACQYLNQPIHSTQQALTKEILEAAQVDAASAPPLSHAVMQIDLASSDSIKADDSVIAVGMVNDSTAAGFTDLQKYSESLASTNPALAGIKGSRIGNVGGCEFYESNAVPVESNWQSSAHNAYHTYVFGHQAFIASSLGKTNLSQKNFSVMVRNFPLGSNSLDPASLIAAAAAYNFFFGVVAAPTPSGTDRFRRIRSESSIG